MWDTLFPYIAALLPTAGVLALFVYLIKNVLEADRKERIAQAQLDREQDRHREQGENAAGDRGAGLS